MPLTRNILTALEHLAELNVTISDILLSILVQDQAPEGPGLLHSNAINDLVLNYYTVLNAFRTHTTFAAGTQQWISYHATTVLIQEVEDLTDIKNGWHGCAHNAQISQFESIDAGAIASTAKCVAPYLWALFESILSGDARNDYEESSQEEEDEEDEEDASETDNGQGDRLLHIGTDDDAVRLRELRVISFITAIARIKNQKCNAFATNMGLFLHASGTCQRAIHTMSRIGLSTSSKTIDRTVNSLSRKAVKAIQDAAQSLQYMMVYDNLVIDFGAPGQSTVDNSQRSLWNLTTGTYINHHFNPEDLRFAEYMRKHDRFNDEEDHSMETQRGYDDLVELYSGSTNKAGLSSHMHFFAWLLRSVICNHGPLFFRTFKSRVGLPVTVEQLPIRKTDQVPVRAMKHDNSTVSGNINAIQDMLQQGGIKRHSPEEEPVPGEPPNVSEYVLIVSGDLGTGERIESARRRRAMDICVWNSLHYVIFVPGMFHVKMALVDMLWKLFIKPFATQSDPTSAVTSTKYLCPNPKDANKLLKGPPTYQQMKRYLTHLGVAERLTCWRTALEHRFGPSIWSDLEDRAFNAQFTLQFTWNDIEAMSIDLVKTHFSAKKIRERRRSSDISARDRELENTMLRNYYMLFYEETIYAMNHGDIGRLERCLIDWIPAFRAVGKHKYAYHLTSFFLNVHYVYPAPLKNAIRQSMLCNLNGKEGKFQGNDWVVELNNLYTKACFGFLSASSMSLINQIQVVYGGKGSNRTLLRVIKKSPLIQVYRNVMTSIDSLYLLGSQTVRHGEPDMTKTYAEMVREFHANRLFKEMAGRTTEKEVMNAFERGLEIIDEKGIEWDLEADSGGSELLRHFDDRDLENGIDID